MPAVRSKGKLFGKAAISPSVFYTQWGPGLMLSHRVPVPHPPAAALPAWVASTSFLELLQASSKMVCGGTSASFVRGLESGKRPAALGALDLCGILQPCDQRLLKSLQLAARAKSF